ncbi:galactose oxidase [Pedobacter sp. HMF7647]|uniref:Galactose oxidase n=1 Tax=Hufsiella arboris TaxID=2695275 RepID=A0A7K1YE65_9SPHI|nr:galactose oxidase [Hufsiella arboris]MXV52907.1 galactose oxidase [Hufsiella arboris]
MRLPDLKLFITAILIFLFAGNSNAQSYGLAFNSYDVVQDKRTSLDIDLDKLNRAGQIELAFDLSFLPNHSNYFGYVFRLIGNEQQNIDLVYDNQFSNHHFKLVVGEKVSNISFDIPVTCLFSEWNRLIISLDVDHDRISLSSGKINLSQSGLHLQKSNTYKLLFGANNYKRYQTTDVPPMKLKDIRISSGGKLVYDFPLSESNGNFLTDKINQSKASVSNPLWVKAGHQKWFLEKEATINGVVSTAFNAAKEEIYFISPDSLKIYSARDGRFLTSVAYRSGTQKFIPGSQSLYGDGQLYSIYTDMKTVVPYNFQSRDWNQYYKTVVDATNYGHINKFYSAADNSVYMIGGYGQFIYKDSVLKYDITKQYWQNVPVKGDVFTPRYLAGLGTTANGDTAYIIGGYGSATGRQIANPRNLYDIMRFTVKDRSFKKLAEIKTQNEDFVFANSLIIDSKHKTYYGLIFPQNKYKTSLQLIKGSLMSPDYELLGDNIPFLFHDVESYVDFFYCAQTKKFFAVTLLKVKNQTQVKIFSLLAPPEPFVVTSIENKISISWVIAGTAILLAGILLFFYFKRKRVRKNFIPEKPLSAEILEVLNKPSSYTHSENRVKFESNDEESAETQPVKSSVFLFGDVQLFTANGTDITGSFTPLLKELFAVILIYSVKWGRGVSSEKLNEILWFDKSEQSARNNRSVNIAKLKSLLDQFNGKCNLVKNSGNYKIEVDYSEVFVDYHSFLNIISSKNKISKENVTQLTQITQRGNFLANMEFEWLDIFKSEVSNEVIDYYLEAASLTTIASDPEFLIRLANHIFYVDPVNEEAMRLKCKALVFLGKHSLAKSTFENFNKEYRLIYGENFMKDFHAVLEY